ncbi:MAG: pilus assembly PilX N-terminal domain-containing protein [Patescibacteria group bacterium]
MKAVMINPKQPASNEKGFVSLVVALTLVIVLALLTVGFAQLSRREQKQALDKQLSVQANYAAETGINDVVKAIQGGLVDINNDPKTCLRLTPDNSSINLAANVNYTCELVDLKPPNLVYTNVAPEIEHSTTFSAARTDGTPSTLSEITVQWDRLGNNALPAAVGVFSPVGTWAAAKYPAVLEFSITPFNSSSFDQPTLIGSLFTTFLYPLAGGSGSVAYNHANSGSIAGATCNSTVCKVMITGIAAPPSASYTIRFMPRYATTNITISAKDASGNKLDFVGGQAMIDSTGKAQDVLKRIQVRVPLKNKAKVPYSAIETQNVCKRLATEPASTNFISPTTNGVISNVNDPCYLSN